MVEVVELSFTKDLTQNANALIVAGGGGSHRTNYSASGFENLMDGSRTTGGNNFLVRWSQW